MKKYICIFLWAVSGVIVPSWLAAQPNPESEVVESSSKLSIHPIFPTRQSTLKALGTIGAVPKGEFESTNDFNAKKCDAFYQKTAGTADTLYHFIVFGRDSPLSQAYYNPDKQEYRFIGNEIFPLLYRLSMKAGIGLILNRVSIPGKSYVGQNAFGVAKQISVSTENTIAILVPTASGPITKFALNVEPEIARRLKGDLQLVVSTKILSPCVESGRYYSRPTVDSPSETMDNLVGIVGSGDATWEIIKASTGEVLASGGF